MRNVYLLIVIIFALSFSSSLLSPVESFYLKEITKDYSKVGYILGLSSLAFILASPLIGLLSDHFGRKNVMVILLSIGPGLRVLMGLIKDVFFATILRFISGIIASVGTIFLAYIGDALEKSESKNFTYSLYMASIYLGYFFGNMVSGWYVKNLGYYFPVYLLSSLIYLISVYFIIFYLKEVKEERKKIERRKISLFKLSLPIILVILFLSLKNLYWGVEGYLWPYIMQDILGRDAVFYTSILFALTGILPAFVLPVAGRWGDKVGSWPLLFFGWLVMGVSSLSMPSSVYSLPLFAILTIYFEIGASISSPATNSIIVEHTSKKNRGFVFGFISSLTTLFYSLGFFLTGYLLSLTNYVYILLLYGSLIYASFLSSFFLYFYFLRGEENENIHSG